MDFYQAMSLTLALWCFSIATYGMGVEVHESDVLDFDGCQLFHLESGLNTFSGIETSDDTSDGFRFVVPEGHTAQLNLEFHISQSDGTSLVWELQSLDKAETCDSNGTFDFIKYLNGRVLAAEIFEDPIGYTEPSSWDFSPIQGLELDGGVYTLYNNYSFGLSDEAIFEYTVTIEVIEEKSSVASANGACVLALIAILFVFRFRSRKELNRTMNQ